MARKTVAATLVIMLSTNLMAGVVPGRWEKMEKEGVGSRITVTLSSGDVIAGAFKSMTEDGLVIFGADGTEQLLRKADVTKIITADVRGDSLSNGALIGFLSVGVPLVILGGVEGARHGDTGILVASGLLWGGIGALAGIGIDALIKGQITLYEAKLPKPSSPSSNK
jgi:hypothetical protein